MSNFDIVDDNLYGHNLKNQHFLLSKQLINLNHGSFGTVPKLIFEKQHQILLEQESSPEDWFRFIYQPYIDKSRIAIATLIKSDLNDVVLVESASYAVNSVLRSYPFKKDDIVIHFSCDYQMVIDTLDYVKRTVGIIVISIPVLYPVLNETRIIDSFQNELDKYDKVTMCVYSHITSMVPSMTLPIKELTVLAKKKCAVVFVDGAHVPGVIDIDMNALTDIGVDLYTGNCHKWLFAPKGAAFLWVKKALQSQQCPQPSVISSSMKYDYVGRFEYTGTRDYTPLVTIPSAIEFIENTLGGIARMRQYNKQLLHDAFHLIQETWKTFVLIPISMNEFMCNIILPLPIHHKSHVDKLTSTLRNKYNISIVCRDIKINLALLQLLKYNTKDVNNTNIVNNNDKMTNKSDIIVYYVRLSTQVYLETSDYRLLAEAVIQIIEEDKEYYYLNPTSSTK